MPQVPTVQSLRPDRIFRVTRENNITVKYRGRLTKMVWYGDKFADGRTKFRACARRTPHRANKWWRRAQVLPNKTLRRRNWRQVVCQSSFDTYQHCTELIDIIAFSTRLFPLHGTSYTFLFRKKHRL